MTLTIHHLGMSQSERVVWLCEELNIPYELKLYKRDPLLAPESLKQLTGNHLGTAPVMQDGEVTLTESGAIVDWIIQKHGDGRLARKPSDSNYADYLQWFHFANATLQSHAARLMTMMLMPDANPEKSVEKRTYERLYNILRTLDNRLGKSSFLAGEELSAADIMSVFSLSTMRYFIPFNLKNYRNITRYLKAINERDAYQRAMKKGDEGMPLLMTAEPPQRSVFEELRLQNEKNQQSQK